MMFVVMDFHRLGIDVRFQRVECIGQWSVVSYAMIQAPLESVIRGGAAQVERRDDAARKHTRSAVGSQLAAVGSYMPAASKNILSTDYIVLGSSYPRPYLASIHPGHQ